jgi:hypothetical protein
MNTEQDNTIPRDFRKNSTTSMEEEKSNLFQEFDQDKQHIQSCLNVFFTKDFYIVDPY